MLNFDGGHWYKRDGSACYLVNNKPVTLTIAKKMDLVPSVTSILDILKNPGLEMWKQRKLVLAACENAASPYDDIVELAMWESSHALQLGSLYHGAIEKMIPVWESTEDPVAYHEWADSNLEFEFPTSLSSSLYHWYRGMGFQHIAIEKTFCSPEGYGGMIDLIAKRGREVWIVDWKTQGTDGKSFRYYKKWAVQLAAYAMGVGLPNARIATVVVSTTDEREPGVKDWTDKGTVKEWYDLFTHMFALWKSPLCAGYQVKPYESE